MLLRHLTPFMRFKPRFYAATKISETMATLHTDLKQVHQETLRHIDPNARIKIRSEIRVNVRSADVHAYPGANVFVAELHGQPAKNCTATMKIQVSDDEKEVDVELAKVAECTDFYCELAVPIRADLYVDCLDVVSIANMYGAELCVTAQKDISTKDIRAERIGLTSAAGNITCKGLLLGQTTNVETQAKGNISLDKVQGTSIRCKTTEGNISTNSCYVDASTFETDTGNLQLKNVHKKTSVYVHKKGVCSMTGVHGNIYVRSNGGDLSLQLSQLTGENIVIADHVDVAKINISDAIEENSYIDIVASNVTLESSLSHLSDCQSDNNQHFRMSTEPDNENKLLICTKGAVSLGKLSWADNMRTVLGNAEYDGK